MNDSPLKVRLLSLLSECKRLQRSSPSPALSSSLASATDQLQRLRRLEVLHTCALIIKHTIERVNSASVDDALCFARVCKRLAAERAARGADDDVACVLNSSFISSLLRTIQPIIDQVHSNIEVKASKLLQDEFDWPNVSEGVVALATTTTTAAAAATTSDAGHSAAASNLLLLHQLRPLSFLECMFLPVERSFAFHFMSPRSTNRIDKPQWATTHLLKQLDRQHALILRRLQPIFDEVTSLDISHEWMIKLVELMSRRVRACLCNCNEQRRRAAVEAKRRRAAAKSAASDGDDDDDDQIRSMRRMIPSHDEKKEEEMEEKTIVESDNDDDNDDDDDDEQVKAFDQLFLLNINEGIRFDEALRNQHGYDEQSPRVTDVVDDDEALRRRWLLIEERAALKHLRTSLSDANAWQQPNSSGDGVVAATVAPTPPAVMSLSRLFRSSLARLASLAPHRTRLRRAFIQRIQLRMLEEFLSTIESIESDQLTGSSALGERAALTTAAGAVLQALGAWRLEPVYAASIDDKEEEEEEVKGDAKKSNRVDRSSSDVFADIVCRYERCYASSLDQLVALLMQQWHQSTRVYFQRNGFENGTGNAVSMDLCNGLTGLEHQLAVLSRALGAAPMEDVRERLATTLDASLVSVVLQHRLPIRHRTASAQFACDMKALASLVPGCRLVRELARVATLDARTAARLVNAADASEAKQLMYTHDIYNLSFGEVLLILKE